MGLSNGLFNVEQLTRLQHIQAAFPHLPGAADVGHPRSIPDFPHLLTVAMKGVHADTQSLNPNVLIRIINARLMHVNATNFGLPLPRIQC
jgi:hypothetical protein